MNQLITTAGQPATMSSREIAALTGKDHSHVLRDIRNMVEALFKEDPNLDGLDLKGFSEKSGFVLVLREDNWQTKEILVPKRETLILVSGYSLPMRARIIDRWQELETAQAPAPAELSRMDILKLAMESEEARIKAEAERDEAIRTKALIGSRREATAMATAAAKSKEVNRLKHELGRNQLHATVKAAKKMTGIEYDWRAMRKHCKEHGIDARNVVDEQYGSVKAWPAMAWRDVHGVDLETLFQTDKEMEE